MKVTGAKRTIIEESFFTITAAELKEALGLCDDDELLIQSNAGDTIAGGICISDVRVITGKRMRRYTEDIAP